MYLIAGLGNPGRKYVNTRHNTGFMCIDEFARRHSISITKRFMNGLAGEGMICGEKVILVKPETYMNLSGECVSAVRNFYKIEHQKMIVVFDDVDFPLGSVKLRKNGSAGTHNGMKNIIEHVKTQDFPRIRVGIGCDKGRELYEYVLSPFGTEEKQLLNESIIKAADILDEIIKNGTDSAMNKYNVRVKKNKEGEE